MKILLWSQCFWPEHAHINEVAQSLTEAGHLVTVLTGKPNYPGGEVYAGYRAWGVQEESHEGMDIVRVPILPRGKGRALGLVKNYLSFIATGGLIAPLVLRKRQFDVVFVYAPSPILQTLPALWIARLRGIPLVLWVQDLWPEALVSTGFVRNRWLLRGVGLVVRHIYRRSDLLLIPSQAFLNSVTSHGCAPEKVVYHPNSAGQRPPVQKLSDSTRQLVQDVGGQFSVVYAGNLGTVQSLDTVISTAYALRAHTGLRFYLIGSGSMAIRLEQAIANEGLSNITLHRWVASDEIQAVYAAASVLLVPLKDDAQIGHTIPNKMQVYLATGKPIIVSSNGEVARILQLAKAGVCCPAGDAEALAEAVLQLQAMSDVERKVLGDNGRAFFQLHFELGLTTKKLEGLLEGMVNKFSSQSRRKV